MHTCGLAWLIGTLWIFTYLRGPLPQSLQRVWRVLQAPDPGPLLQTIKEWRLIQGEWARCSSHHFGAMQVLFQVHMPGLRCYDGSWQKRSATGGRVMICGTRSTSHGLGLHVPAASMAVAVQQCLEAWAFSDEFCGLLDPPSVLSIYLLPALQPDTARDPLQRRDAVALSPDMPSSACSLYASFPRITWDWDTILVPTFADKSSLDIQYTAYSVQAVGMHLGGASGTSLGKYCTILRHRDDLLLAKEAHAPYACTLQHGHQRGARMLWCVRRVPPELPQAE